MYRFFQAHSLSLALEARPHLMQYLNKLERNKKCESKSRVATKSRKWMASKAYRRRQSVSSEATAFMKRQTSAHEIRSSEERNLKICRNSSGGMLLNIPVSI